MFNAISLYSGAGGLDLGFESTQKFTTRVAVEFDERYAASLLRNQEAFFYASSPFLKGCEVINAPVEQLLDQGFFVPGQADIVYGGPPCQPFSTIGKRLGLKDPRSRSIFDFFRVVETVAPSVFVFENVPNLKLQWSGLVFQEIVDLIESLGCYTFQHQIVNFSSLGAATSRKRLLIVGVRKDLDVAANFFQPVNGSLTVGEVFKGLPSPNSSRGQYPTDHVAPQHTEKVRDRFVLLKPGEQCKIRKRWRLDLSRPSNSLMAGGNSGYVLHIHPTEPREITLREAARIQGFPDEYVFMGKPLDVAKQIVNAVPVPVGNILGQRIANILGAAK